jgi:hypothetical protein
MSRTCMPVAITKKKVASMYNRRELLIARRLYGTSTAINLSIRLVQCYYSYWHPVVFQGLFRRLRRKHILPLCSTSFQYMRVE